MSAKADMTVEEVIEPGTPVTVQCDICEGTGKYEGFKKDDDTCWRCEGVGAVVCVTPDRRCPSCDISWVGAQIAKKDMRAYGSTHFGNELGVYRFDQTVAYQCPGCGKFFSRYRPGVELTLEQVHNGTFKELVG